MTTYTFKFVVGKTKLSEKDTTDIQGYNLTNLATAFKDGQKRAANLSEKTGEPTTLISVDGSAD